MSLRLRLIGMIAIVLVVSLLVGGAIACLNASGSVGTEMRSALLIGQRTLAHSASAVATSPDPSAELRRLVSLFQGNRHLRVSVPEDPTIAAGPAVEIAPFGEPPAWFVRLIAVPRLSERVPVMAGGRAFATILVETDARNETLDVWNDFNNTVIVLLLFSAVTILLVYLFIGRALRPLYRLSDAFERIGQGRYGALPGDRVAPELSRLHDSFNRMAARLAAADADNRRLHEQILTVQEQERAEIARDLHDEVGPYLFAINVDAASASRLVGEGQADEALAALRLIAESVTHVQHELRGVVRRLRPAGLAEFGLRDAIGDMVEFWRRRHPEVEFRVDIAPGCERLDDLLDTTIYRVVQECLSNALRHGSPRAVAVRLAPAEDGEDEGERIVLKISDDGAGLPNSAVAGFGLRGMAERVRAMGGTLGLANSDGAGLAVTATLPRRPQPAPAPFAANAIGAGPV